MDHYSDWDIIQALPCKCHMHMGKEGGGEG